MAARVALLMAFTGLFAAAWSSDQPPTAAVVTGANARRPPDRPAIVEDIRRPLSISPVRRGVAVSSEADFSDCVLPEGIQPGRYRVIDEQGSVGWLTLPADTTDDVRAGGPVASQSENFYVSQSTRGRLYFIRVEAAQDITAIPAEQPVRR